MLTLPTALTWSARLIGLAVALQTIELLQLRRVYADDGIWRFELLAQEYDRCPKPLRWILRRALTFRTFTRLLWLNIVAALLVLGTGRLQPMPVLLAITLLTCVRWRGAFNGGSDAMTVLILLALSAAAIFPQSPGVQLGALAYIAVQTTLSYAIAGIAKLKEPRWRGGQALAGLAQTSYATPAFVGERLRSPALARLCAWSIIGFECGFGLAWLNPQLGWFATAMGALFHLSNAAILGLNRFFFAWLASYPALLYVSQLGLLG
jgi:hypothetical protein